MAIKRELIQFTIVNSTDCNYNLPLFQQNVYSVNATTKYSWDVTTADLSCGFGSIVVNSITYNLTYTPNLAGLLAALNALGFGFFCSETIGGNTYIYVVDDTNVYGVLDLCTIGSTTTTTSTTSTTTTAAPTTTTTTTTTTAAPTTTSTTTTTTTEAPTTTSTTTTTTTEAPTTTSTTTTTTTEAPTTTSTTTTTTTEAPTTTSTTTTTTTEAPTTTSTTTTTTTEAPTTTSTTTTTTTVLTCLCYVITNNTGGLDSYTYQPCGSGTPTLISIPNGTTDRVCSEIVPTTTGSVIILPCDDITNCSDNTDCVGCTASTSTTTTTTTAAPTTTSTTTTTTTAATTTTTTTTSTSTTTTTLFSNLIFDATAAVNGYQITAIDVNSVTPTLTGGAGVPFGTDTHTYNTTQTGSNETLNLTIGSYTLNGCITVVDSAANSYQQNVTGNGALPFTGLVINNTTAVQITLADNTC